MISCLNVHVKIYYYSVQSWQNNCHDAFESHSDYLWFIQAVKGQSSIQKSINALLSSSVRLKSTKHMATLTDIEKH